MARTQSNCIWLIRRRSVLGFETSKTVGAQTSERITSILYSCLWAFVSAFNRRCSRRTHPSFFILFNFPQCLHFSSNLIQKSEPVIDHLSFCMRVFNTVKKNPAASPGGASSKMFFKLRNRTRINPRHQELFYAWNKFLIF